MTAGKRLRVHVLRTAAPGARIALKHAVFCPTRGEHVALEECATCARRRDVGEDSRGVYVDCNTELDVPRAELVEPPPAEPDRSWSVADVMTTDVVGVTPELSLSELVQLFIDRGISGAPVLEADRVVGIVSKTDVVRAFDGQPVRVRDIMSPVTLVLSAASSLEHAAAVMAFEGMHRVPVVSDGNEVVGLVTSLDLLRWMARTAGYVVPDRTALQAD